MLRRILSSSSSCGVYSCAATAPSSSLTSSSSIAVALLVDSNRGLKTRKRPKVGAKYVKDSQAWRENYQSEQQRLLADSLRGYVAYSTTRRIVPWDPRFKPFDREETDGVYAVMRYMMKDKMEMSRNHAHVVKRLMANVGLIGPQVTTKARWRSVFATRTPERATTIKDYNAERDKSLRAKWYSD